MAGGVVAGHRIPLPASDFYLALATVALFLPAVVLLHRATAAVLKVITKAAHRA